MTGPEGAQAAQQALKDLHDVALPPQVAMTPQTAGWYALALLAGLLVVWTCVTFTRRFLRDRYRRAALRELAALEAGLGEEASRSAALRGLPVLLRRTALAAWPRGEVAPLTGDAWLAFLDDAYGGNGFSAGPGRPLALAAYETDAGLRALNEREARALFALAGTWIRRHRGRA